MDEITEILGKLWEMPWYKVLIIAAADDAILFIKIWPAYLALLVVYVAILAIFR